MLRNLFFLLVPTGLQRQGSVGTINYICMEVHNLTRFRDETAVKIIYQYYQGRGHWKLHFENEISEAQRSHVD